jgi:hemerythrin
MPHIAWDERLNLGIAELDAQHKLLLGHANRLIEGMDKGVAEAMVADLVQKLREYTLFHFRRGH